jgi:hypothetical protein
MTASCCSHPGGLSASIIRARALRAPGVRPVRAIPWGLLAGVGLLVAAATLLAPEQPAAQAEICQRHNGAAACRIW